MRVFKKIVFILITFTIAGCLLLPVLYIFRAPMISVYNSMRPLLLDGGGQQCINSLNSKQVQFQKLGDTGTQDCPVLNAVKINSFQNTKISSPFILSCPTADRVASWLEDIGASSIRHMGTLNCRKRRGGSLYSEHSFGTAIDISHINGASVKEDWGKNTEEGDILAKATKSACMYFSNVLTPDTNKLHHDHYHLDTGVGFGCEVGKFATLILKTLQKFNKYLL